MNCLQNIKSTSVPHDVFIRMTQLYQKMGMNYHYQSLFSDKIDYYKHKTAEDNAKEYFKLFSNSFKSINPSRMQSLLLKSSVANNKSEQLFKNILMVFKKIHYDSYDHFQLTLVEIRELVSLLFKDVIDTPRFRKLTKKKSLLKSNSTSLRESLEQYLTQINHIEHEKSIEPFFLYVNFMVDFIQMKVFDFDYNEQVGILLFYILLIEKGFDVCHYIGFFPKLITVRESLFGLIAKSSFQWEEGLSDVMPLTKFFIKVFFDLFEDMEDLTREMRFDKESSVLKTDFVENIITKMPETFSKKDIRKKYPHVSDSTINRTLKRLQEEDKIRSLGKGRNAKWVKMFENYDVEGQLKLYLED